MCDLTSVWEIKLDLEFHRHLDGMFKSTFLLMTCKLYNLEWIIWCDIIWYYFAYLWCYVAEHSDDVLLYYIEHGPIAPCIEWWIDHWNILYWLLLYLVATCCDLIHDRTKGV